MLYKFEKYYLSLALFKVYHFFRKVWGNIVGRYFLIFVWLITSLMIAGFVIIYFFIGLNVFLEKVHLEKYRIEKIPIMKSEFDLRPYFKK